MSKIGSAYSFYLNPWYNLKRENSVSRKVFRKVSRKVSRKE